MLAREIGVKRNNHPVGGRRSSGDYSLPETPSIVIGAFAGTDGTIAIGPEAGLRVASSDGGKLPSLWGSVLLPNPPVTAACSCE
jgi:hypothetical protein